MRSLKPLPTKPSTVANVEMGIADGVLHIGVPLVREYLQTTRFVQTVFVGGGRHPSGSRGLELPYRRRGRPPPGGNGRVGGGPRGGGRLRRNLTLDAEVIALGGTITAYASDAELQPRVPFWPLLLKNVTIRLVGSDDLPEEAERRAVEEIASCLEAGVLHPRIALRLPLERIAEAHEAVEGGRSGGRVKLDID